jgi:hypothetical protein
MKAMTSVTDEGYYEIIKLNKKVIGCKKIKVFKLDSQNGLRLLIPEGE